MADDPIREEHLKVMNDLAKELDSAINPDSPKKYGFALLVFDFGSGGYMNYISNSRREGMIQAMREFIAHSERTYGNQG